MRTLSPLSISGVISVLLTATLALSAQAPEAHGIPPRATPADYQVNGRAGTLTLAAEFVGHSLPTPQATYTSEDYVAVEAALFGPADARATLSASDFTLRINGRKMPLTGAHFGLVFSSLKDPEWAPPTPEGGKSKTSIGGTGGGGGDPPPTPPKMPIALRRVMEQRVQKAALPEGDRPLPQAGLLFFQYRGKQDGIRSVELSYKGKDGNVTLTLQ